MNSVILNLLRKAINYAIFKNSGVDSNEVLKIVQKNPEVANVLLVVAADYLDEAGQLDSEGFTKRGPEIINRLMAQDSIDPIVYSDILTLFEKAESKKITKDVVEFVCFLISRILKAE